MACESERYDGSCGDCGCKRWPIPMEERARLALAHEPEASASPDGYRLATCVVPECKRPMVAMWHLWLDWTEIASPKYPYDTRIVKEIHMCHQCATDLYGAPHPDFPADLWNAMEDDGYGP